MKTIPPAEHEALLERVRDALDECLDALALYHIQPAMQGSFEALSAGEYAQHLGQQRLDEINEVLRPIYSEPAP